MESVAVRERGEGSTEIPEEKEQHTLEDSVSWQEGKNKKEKKAVKEEGKVRKCSRVCLARQIRTASTHDLLTVPLGVHVEESTKLTESRNVGLVSLRLRENPFQPKMLQLNKNE